MFGVASIIASSTITTGPAKSVLKHNFNGIISTCGGFVWDEAFTPRPANIKHLIQLVHFLSRNTSKEFEN